MKVAVMQPYLFPYIGYFQLISAADIFVLYDDVTYIKQGWINRNRILVNRREHLFTLELRAASSFKLINQITIGDNKNKLLKTIEQAYKKAPFYKEGFELISEIFSNAELNLALFLENSIRKIAAWLDIRSRILVSSQSGGKSDLKGQDRILAICRSLDAQMYINAIGGKQLYQSEVFRQNNLELRFIKTNPICYSQMDADFVSGLSIIDIMMFNSRETIVKKIIPEYTLVK